MHACTLTALQRIHTTCAACKLRKAAHSIQLNHGCVCCKAVCHDMMLVLCRQRGMLVVRSHQCGAAALLGPSRAVWGGLSPEPGSAVHLRAAVK